MTKHVVAIINGLHGGGLFRTGGMVQAIFPSGKAEPETIDPMELYRLIEGYEACNIGKTYMLPIGAVVKFYGEGEGDDREEIVLGREEALSSLAPVN